MMSQHMVALYATWILGAVFGFVIGRGTRR